MKPVKHNYLLVKGNTEMCVLAKNPVEAINKVSKTIPINSIHEIHIYQLGSPRQQIL
jgi:hypothetical protein